MKKSDLPKPNRFNFRGVQLDLARQVENFAFIKSFIDFIEKNGFNFLVLYLEGRIRTKAFPYMGKHESYSTDEIKRIVEYAAKKKIEIVPIVSTFGHAEHFLKYTPFEHLAELRNGEKGRFSKLKSVFCPSRMETYDFLDAYLSEVSALFPSEYFHVGCDEAWDMGFCELCKKRLETETSSNIFAGHLAEIHRIITGKLKKKMIIWDDLLEHYPEAMEKIPKDIIMCSWQYEKFVDKPTAHFGNRLRTDKFQLYDKLGFGYIFATWSYNFRNISSFTSYATQYNPIGGLVTTWELMNSFPFNSYPVISYAGRLWRGEGTGSEKQDQADALALTTGIKDNAVIFSIRTALSMSSASLSSNPHSLMRGPLSNEEFARYCVVNSVIESIEKCMVRNDVLEDILVSLKIEAEYYLLRELFNILLEPFSTTLAKKKAFEDIKNCVENIKSHKEVRNAQWDKHRENVCPCRPAWLGESACKKDELIPCNLKAYFDKLTVNILKLADELKKGNGVLTVSFFLPEYSSAQNTDFFIKYASTDKWEKVAGGVFKQVPFAEAFYTYKFLVSAEKSPIALRIESFGYGGQGLTFLEVLNSHGRFVPDSISRIEGIVENPQHLLDEDQKWCFVGEKDTRREYTLPELAQAKHCIEINLKDFEHKLKH
jgi:hypothetical protein